MSDSIAGKPPGGDADRPFVAEYVLGLLEGSERATMERAIRRDPALAAEARFWENHLAALNADYAPVAPPSAVLARIETRLFGSGRKPGWWRSLALWRAATGLALAAAIVGIGLNLLQPAPQAPEPGLVTALLPVESDLSMVALFEPGTGALRFTASGSPAGAGRDYELWFIAEGEAPISMGTIGVGTGVALAVPEDLRPRFAEGITLAVTLEPAGGSPDGNPTGPIVSAGTVTRL